MRDLERQLAAEKAAESDAQQKLKELQAEAQKQEETRAKGEEREGKLKALLAKTKKNFDEVRQQLTAKEAECLELTAKVWY